MQFDRYHNVLLYGEVWNRSSMLHRDYDRSTKEKVTYRHWINSFSHIDHIESNIGLQWQIDYDILVKVGQPLCNRLSWQQCGEQAIELYHECHFPTELLPLYHGPVALLLLMGWNHPAIYKKYIRFVLCILNINLHNDLRKFFSNYKILN